MAYLKGLGLMCLGASLAVAAAACSAGNDGSELTGGPGAGGTSGEGGTSALGGGAGTIGTGAQAGTSVGGQACAGVNQDAAEAVLPADVIWAIDTSCSMFPETEAVQNNMNAFSQQIVDAGVDIRIVMIAASPEVVLGLPLPGICVDPPLGSGNCPADTNLPKYAHISEGVGSTDALQKFISTYSTWQQQLRSNSIKIFVTVTDDNSAITAADFTNQVEALDPNQIKPGLWQFYSIHCYTQCLEAASIGSVYTDLVAQTGGVSGDLCLQDFKPVFDQLAAGIVGSTKLDCGWSIPPPPDGETFNKGQVNLEFTDNSGATTTIGKVPSAADCGAQGGWYYDSETNPETVLVCPSTCNTIQAADKGKIELKFGCDTIVVPK